MRMLVCGKTNCTFGLFISIMTSVWISENMVLIFLCLPRKAYASFNCYCWRIIVLSKFSFLASKVLNFVAYCYPMCSIFMFKCVMQVTDYTRDLDEMQNVSREDYLASLRRWGPVLKCVDMLWNVCCESKLCIAYTSFSLQKK